MNKLQELISDAEARKKSHNKSASLYGHLDGDHHYWNGRTDECDFWLQKLTLLLNAEAITEDSHLRKHDVGQSAAESDISTKGNAPGESSVHGNEAEKGVCGYFVSDNTGMTCKYCGHHVSKHHL